MRFPGGVSRPSRAATTRADLLAPTTGPSDEALTEAFSQCGGTAPTIVACDSPTDEDELAAVVALALAQQRRSARDRRAPMPPRWTTSVSALGGRAGGGSQGVEVGGVEMTESGLELAGGLARRNSGMRRSEGRPELSVALSLVSHALPSPADAGFGTLRPGIPGPWGGTRADVSYDRHRHRYEKISDEISLIYLSMGIYFA